MKVHLPIYARLLLGFLLNLAFLGAVFYGFFRLQFRVDMDSLLLGRAGDRIQAVGEVIAAELADTPEADWGRVLDRFSQAYRAQFFLFRADGTQAGGEAIELPLEVRERIAGSQESPSEPPGRSSIARRGPPPGRGPMRRWTPPPLNPQPKFMLRAGDPSRYWVGVRLPFAEPARMRSPPLVLLGMSDSLRGGGLFFDPTPWIAVGFGAVLLSVLFWTPLVHRLTRAIGQMTRATSRIAEGRFDTRVPVQRADELGRLAVSINQLAARLTDYVQGQKRFLGDIAHELCAPLARIQMALGILEQRADPGSQTQLQDLEEEVREMSDLIHDLLSFTRAGLQPEHMTLESVPLLEIAQPIAAREAPRLAALEVRIDPACRVLAEPDLLRRALANLVRNAVRYAGSAGPILLEAESRGDCILVRVSDSGPGVPEETLHRIFDPFFRVEPSRSRETGGIGLGLAIVKTCIEACQGTVVARNRSPSGLEVEIALKHAPADHRAGSPS